MDMTNRNLAIFFVVFVAAIFGLGALLLRAPDDRGVSDRDGAETADVKVTNPQINSTIISPLLVSGEARGTWFFEASFPVRVEDANGDQLGIGIAEALSNWMTTSTVPFRGVISFTSPPTTTAGFLIFEKDNPSGLPENADEFAAPVTIAPAVDNFN